VEAGGAGARREAREVGDLPVIEALRLGRAGKENGELGWAEPWAEPWAEAWHWAQAAGLASQPVRGFDQGCDAGLDGLEMSLQGLEERCDLSLKRGIAGHALPVRRCVKA
jgi:hypothetical protein